jgi:F-type H+-transporting ATPase subunit b
MQIYIAQVVTQIIAFLAMVWVLKRYAWGPLLGLLDQRRNKILAEFDAIEEGKKGVQAQVDHYQQKLRDLEAASRSRIQEAVDQGRKIAQEIQDDAQKQAKALITKAQGELKQDIAKAKVQLKKELVDMTMSATQMLMKEQLNDPKHEKLVSDFVEQVESQ